jgi:serine/threonine-protein kinase
LNRAAPSREAGCIELHTQGQTHIVKPRRLYFESFGADPEWNYFRLETGPLDPSGVYPDLEPKWKHEELTDVGGKFYAERACWIHDDYAGAPLPPDSRPVSRHFEGTFAIFQKTSRYNKNRSTYDGRHNRMSADEFRAHITDVIAYLKKVDRGS